MRSPVGPFICALTLQPFPLHQGVPLSTAQELNSFSSTALPGRNSFLPAEKQQETREGKLKTTKIYITEIMESPDLWNFNKMRTT